MATAKPRLTFLFPHRWLVKDRKYLQKNLIRQIGLYAPTQEDRRLLEEVERYRVLIFYQYHEPIDIPLTKENLQELLSSMLPNAKCLSLDKQFQQHTSKTMLPLMDFQLYF